VDCGFLGLCYFRFDGDMLHKKFFYLCLGELILGGVKLK